MYAIKIFDYSRSVLNRADRGTDLYITSSIPVRNLRHSEYNQSIYMFKISLGGSIFPRESSPNNLPINKDNESYLYIYLFAILSATELILFVTLYILYMPME